MRTVYTVLALFALTALAAAAEQPAPNNDLPMLVLTRAAFAENLPEGMPYAVVDGPADEDADARFLSVTLPGGLAPSNDEAVARSAREVAAACRRVSEEHADGLLLALPAAGAWRVPDPRWEPARALAEARGDGRAVGEAVQLDNRLLLLVTDGVAQAPPLWGAWFAGLCEGLAASDPDGPHLLTRASLTQVNPAVMATVAEGTRRLVEPALGPHGRRQWEARGSVGLAIPESNDALRATAAWLYSGRFALLEQAPPDGLLPEALRGASRAGPYALGGVPAYALRRELAAELLVWGGVPAETHLAGLRREVAAHNLATGASTRLVPEEGVVTLPAADGPLLVGGLPLHGHALPACLWMEFGALEPGHVRVSYGVRNRLPVRLTGALTAVGTSRAVLSAPVERVDLAPGEEAEFGAVLRGDLDPGTLVPLRLQFAGEAGETATRTFPLLCYPPAVSEVPLQSPLAAPPWAPDLDRDNTREVVAALRNGSLVCVERKQDTWGPRWTVPGPSHQASEVTGLALPPGEGFVVARGNMVTAYGPGADTRWQRASEGDASAWSGLAVRRGAVLQASGRSLLEFRAGGASVRVHRLPLVTEHLTEDGRFVAGAMPGDPHAGALCALDAAGRPLWRVRLPWRPAALSAGAATGDLLVAVAGPGGETHIRDPRLGRLLGSAQLEVEGDVLGVAVAAEADGHWSVAVASAGRLSGAGAQGATWTQPVPCAGPPVAVPYADAVTFLVAGRDGRLSLFGGNGPRVWSTPWSLRPGGSMPLVTDLDGDGARECVWAAPTGRLQVLPLDGARRTSRSVLLHAPETSSTIPQSKR